MAWLTDNLRAAIAALNPFSRGESGCGLPTAFTHQLALAAYVSSGMLRKVIKIPADDRVREWRDWQAEKDQITAIEAEERRLNLIAKVRFAEILRGIGGGAMILITAGDHASPLNPETLRKGGLVAINVVSRWQLQGVDWVQDLANPDYQTPTMWQITEGTGGQKNIHPSRVVCFRGDPVPAGAAMSDEEAFWGDSRLLQVFREVQRADDAHLWVSQLIKKAKLLRIGIPDLDQMDEERLAKRIGVIALGENSLNATVFRSSASKDDGGETISDFTMPWSGIPEVLDAFDQRVAAVADIPFTRLMGRSPAGMNATGEHDDTNWNKMVAAGQKLETRPCLDRVDAAMLPSAGIKPANVTWTFAPLDVPSEKEQSDTFDKTMDAATKLQNTGAIPEEAFAKGLQNLMAEREWMPGLDQALAEIPEDERYGLNPEVDPNAVDPSQLQAANEPDVSEAQLRRAANDKKAGKTVALEGE